MTGIFRRNLFINALLLLPYALILGLYGLLHPTPAVIDAQDSQFYTFILGVISNPIVQQILSIILVFSQASMINRMVIKNRISNQITLLPGMFYILMMSFFPSFLGFSDYLIANTFIIGFLFIAMDLFQRTHLVPKIYLSGLLFGVSILVVPEYIYLIPMGIFTLLYLNGASLKIFVQFFGGVVTTLLFYYETLFLFDFDIFHEAALYRSDLKISLNIEALKHGELIATLIGVGISIFQFNSYGRKKSMASQKKIMLLFYIMLLIFVATLLMPAANVKWLYLMAIPLCILVDMTFLDIKNYLIAELVHIVLLVLLACFQWGVLPYSF